MGWRNWLFRSRQVEVDPLQEKMDRAEQRIYEKDVKRLDEAKAKVNESKKKLQGQLLDILKQELDYRTAVLKNFDKMILPCSPTDYFRSEGLNPRDYELQGSRYWVTSYKDIERAEEAQRIGFLEDLEDLGAIKCCNYQVTLSETERTYSLYAVGTAIIPRKKKN